MDYTKFPERVWEPVWENGIRTWITRPATKADYRRRLEVIQRMRKVGQQ